MLWALIGTARGVALPEESFRILVDYYVDDPGIVSFGHPIDEERNHQTREWRVQVVLACDWAASRVLDCEAEDYGIFLLPDASTGVNRGAEFVRQLDQLDLGAKIEFRHDGTVESVRIRSGWGHMDTLVGNAFAGLTVTDPTLDPDKVSRRSPLASIQGGGGAIVRLDWQGSPSEGETLARGAARVDGGKMGWFDMALSSHARFEGGVLVEHTWWTLALPRSEVGSDHHLQGGYVRVLGRDEQPELIELSVSGTRPYRGEAMAAVNEAVGKGRPLEVALGLPPPLGFTPFVEASGGFGVPLSPRLALGVGASLDSRVRMRGELVWMAPRFDQNLERVPVRDLDLRTGLAFTSLYGVNPGISLLAGVGRRDEGPVVLVAADAHLERDLGAHNAFVRVTMTVESAEADQLAHADGLRAQLSVGLRRGGL